MKFIDRTKIFIRSGKGGKGCISFLREKFKEFGGPDGGDGGDGGAVYIQGDNRLQSLYDLRRQPHIAAKNGAPGSGRQKAGKAGEDCFIKVPFGTLVFDDASCELLADVVDATPILLLKGGKGGKGNRYFHTNRNRLPYIAQPGENAQELTIRLELKIIADVGFVGFPNAGKSTLMKAVTHADPKIGAYPFTTLSPNLGVIETKNFQQFVLADIPGIIAGAAQGMGLGLEFLRHIERTKLLVILLDGAVLQSDLLIQHYQTLTNELKTYSQALLEKPKIVLLSKADLIVEPDLVPTLAQFFQQQGLPFFVVSAHTRSGLQDWQAALEAALVDLQLNQSVAAGTKP